MIDPDYSAVAADVEDSDPLGGDALNMARQYTGATASSGCPTCSEANELLRSHDHNAGGRESRRPLNVAGREGLLSLIDDVDGLIKSSERASNAFLESEGRLAVIENDMRRGYIRARAALRNILKADVATSARIVEKSRPEVDVDCVGGF